MDVNEQIKANIKLVYRMLHQFSLAGDQDAESLGYEALWKAVLTYKPETGYTFSTYAICVISNAMRCRLRTLNKKRQIKTISLYTPVSDDDSILLIDTLKTSEGPEEVLCNKMLLEAAEDAMSRIINNELTDVQRNIIILWKNSKYKMTQSEIAKVTETSQATVSRTISNFKYKLQTELEEYL